MDNKIISYKPHKQTKRLYNNEINTKSCKVNNYLICYELVLHVLSKTHYNQIIMHLMFDFNSSISVAIQLPASFVDFCDANQKQICDTRKTKRTKQLYVNMEGITITAMKT